MCLVGRVGVHVVSITHTKLASDAETGWVLTNVVDFDRAKALSKKKRTLSLQTTAVCFSESAGEFFVADFTVASSVGKQKVETRGV